MFDEIARTSNLRVGYDMRGASHARLKSTPLQWPCPPDDLSDRHPTRYRNDGVSQTRFADAEGATPLLAFPTANERSFHARPCLPPVEMPDEEFPFLFNTGRLAHQWRTMTTTGKISALNKLNPAPFLEINPQDAAALSIGAKDRVAVRSRRAGVVLPAIVTDRVAASGCFAPFHSSDIFADDLAVNAVTHDAADPISKQPGLKNAAVSLARAAVATPARARALVLADAGGGDAPGMPDAGERGRKRERPCRASKR